LATPVVAVDFGASSIRVVRVELDDGPPEVTVVHRCEHGPVRSADGHRRWGWDRLMAELRRGLDLALALGPVASIGVDTWGVDYGLLDERGELVEPPYSYRDDRTAAYRTVVDRVGERRLYEIAGLQMLPFNTIFQLAAHDREVLGRAAHVVMLPELVVHALTGEVTAERSSAGTTGLLDLGTGQWSDELCGAIGLDRGLLPRIRPAGTRAGRWRDVPVHLVGGHDTASAVCGGAVDGEAFVSAGTWLVVGRERADPDTSEAARRAGFSNELGALGGVRFVRNVAGWWLLDECKRQWGIVDVDRLLAEAASVGGDVRVFDATDPRFLAPADMEDEVRVAAGLSPQASRAAVVRCIVESMAATTSSVVALLGEVRGIRVFGGGSRSTGYLDALRLRSGLPVSVGPVEATALGNALVQGVALGVYESLDAARASLAETAL
jgi:rhamnulokinase